MTKQNKKTIKTKQAPENISFAIALKSNPDDIRGALKKSKAQRKEYYKKLFAPDTLKAIESIANRLGQGGKGYDITKSFPCKSDIAKTYTIESFPNKAPKQASPRMIASLLIAYLNRENGGFSRIFPNGLFLENGALRDLFSFGLIESKGGENEKQFFTFTKKANWILEDKGFNTFEKSLIEGGLL